MAVRLRRFRRLAPALIAGLLFVVPATASASIDVFYSESGQLTLSVDALGTGNGSGTVQVDKPSGATVRHAYLVAASTPGHPAPVDGGITLNGSPVNWDPSKTVSSPIGATNVLADVTALVKPTLDGAPSGPVDLSVQEQSPSAVDGSILAVVFNDPAATTGTVALLFGAQTPAGDQFAVRLAEPVQKSEPGFSMQMSLGISFGFQPSGQYSEVDVNGSRMTTSAGGHDDGEGANGALITAGGVGDSPANPADPNGLDNFCGSAPRCDDELYDLEPFVNDGDTSVDVFTRNPSGDDNIFFAALNLGSTLAVVGEGIVLAPDGTSQTVGQTHELTATVQDDAGAPIVGREVTFRVTSGPNSGLVGTGTTGSDGRATFSYSSSTTGTDTIVAEFDSDGRTRTSNAVSHTWTSGTSGGGDSGGSGGGGGGTTTPRATISLTPQTATRTVGESHTVMAHVENGTGTVRFSVQGAHGLSGSTSVNAAGDALFSYPSFNMGGDRIVAYLDRNRNGVREIGTEPITSATVIWNPPLQQQPREEQLPPDIITADSIDDLPNPQPYKTANIEALAGDVYVQLPRRGGGAGTSQAKGGPRGFIPLRTAAQVPLGTVIEATKGRVAIESTAANTSRRVQQAQFFSGRFQMIQRALNNRRSRPVTEMVLKGGSRRGCPATRRVRPSGAGAEDSARRRSARSRVRRLWGRGRGRFRTRGRYSSATVRGTTWLVEDRCGGTLTRLPRRPANSRVEVRDFLQRRTIRLRAGQSHFARGSSKR